MEIKYKPLLSYCIKDETIRKTLRSQYKKRIEIDKKLVMDNLYLKIDKELHDLILSLNLDKKTYRGCCHIISHYNRVGYDSKTRLFEPDNAAALRVWYNSRSYREALDILREYNVLILDELYNYGTDKNGKSKSKMKAFTFNYYANSNIVEMDVFEYAVFLGSDDWTLTSSRFNFIKRDMEAQIGKIIYPIGSSHKIHQYPFEYKHIYQKFREQKKPKREKAFIPVSELYDRIPNAEKFFVHLNFRRIYDYVSGKSVIQDEKVMKKYQKTLSAVKYAREEALAEIRSDYGIKARHWQDLRGKLLTIEDETQRNRLSSIISAVERIDTVYNSNTRVFSGITNMKREYRQFLKFPDRQHYQIDITNSHWFIVVDLIRENNLKIEQELVDIIHRGDIYETLGKAFEYTKEQVTNEEEIRTEVKISSCKVLAARFDNVLGGDILQ